MKGLEIPGPKAELRLSHFGHFPPVRYYEAFHQSGHVGLLLPDNVRNIFIAR